MEPRPLVASGKNDIIMLSIPRIPERQVNMSNILIRGVDRKVLARLKARAKRHGHSLQGEAKLILEHAAGHTLSEALAVAGRWRQRLDKQFRDAAELIRKDRAR